MIERDRAVCWHPYTQHGLDPDPLPVVRASGAWLELADGRRVLDAISSWWACVHGHAHPRLVRALAEQAARLDHVPFAGCTHEPAVALAEELVRLAPRGLARVFYSDDGSTAVEVALKAAYACWLRRGERRTKFVALQGGYHGDTFGAMAAGDPSPFFRDFEELLFRVERVPCDAGRLGEALEGAAAFIVEPIVQGAAGMRSVPASFLREARALCSSHGAFLIADEVMTGFGRTGTLFACEQAGIAPDLMCLGKGLTSGMLPLAATLAREEIYAAFVSSDRARAFFHGHTFTANPIGCAVALESLRISREEDTPARFRAIGERIAAEVPGSRRFGGIVAADAGVEAGYASTEGERLRSLCRELAPDVLLRPLGNVLYTMPPACVTNEECGRIAEALRAVIASA